MQTLRINVISDCHPNMQRILSEARKVFMVVLKGHTMFLMLAKGKRRTRVCLLDMPQARCVKSDPRSKDMWYLSNEPISPYAGSGSGSGSEFDFPIDRIDEVRW